ncbi:cytochrome P450 family protein [Polyangium sorediatum]|uniref:Cytochrome P450 n=1 Tax=Polyangium sorediatum TaxID=889274 RepID=A0ABT6NZE2_9BACT|nr:cytochrome P450 [Polyangium sorediatum]MDI1433674.1 cytochrome P450 [Polyangium sorediatum]
MQNGSNGEREKATGAVTLSLDPGRVIEDYAAARAQGPVVAVSFADTDAGGDESAANLEDFLTREHLFVSHYDEVLSALVDGRFSSDRRSALTPEQRDKLPPVIEELRLLSESLLSKDPPDHTRLRKLIQPSFSLRAMEVMRPRIQKLTDELLDAAEHAAEARGERAPDRRMDLIEAFAYPMPVTVISDMLGIPLADRAQVKQWTENLLRADRRRTGGMDAETLAKLRQFTSYLRDLFVLKRQTPAEDMITDLLRAEEAGDKLCEDEVLSTVFLLYLAGHVTTVNLIGNGAFALFQHPTELGKLKADPTLAKGVVEETLRYWGPVDFVTARIAKENVHLGGACIPKGEPVMVGLAAANRDPARFSNPDAFDITRQGAERHVAFGKGIHLCVGAPLARVEGQIAFDTLFRRFPAMRLAVPPEEVRWAKSFLRGLRALPVLF